MANLKAGTSVTQWSSVGYGGILARGFTGASHQPASADRPRRSSRSSMVRLQPPAATRPLPDSSSGHSAAAVDPGRQPSGSCSDQTGLHSALPELATAALRWWWWWQRWQRLWMEPNAVRRAAGEVVTPRSERRDCKHECRSAVVGRRSAVEAEPGIGQSGE